MKYEYRVEVLSDEAVANDFVNEGFLEAVKGLVKSLVGSLINPIIKAIS